MFEGLGVGRIVHVRIDGRCRPAIVLHVWDKETGGVNLSVFPDGTNDPGHADVAHSQWWTSILPGEDANCWHWPERE